MNNATLTIRGMRSPLLEFLHFRVWSFSTCDHGLGVPDHGVGGEGGQHAADGVAVVVVGLWGRGCALKINYFNVIQGGRDELACVVYRNMDNMVLLFNSLKAQHKVMTVVVQGQITWSVFGL